MSLSSPEKEGCAVIARVWRGWTASADADGYHRYMTETGVKELRETPGNRGVYMLRRADGDRAEFVMVSLWESMDGIRAFAGDHPDRAVFYPEDDRYLVDREWDVGHYDVLVVEGV
jgi:heme-degrading monooxygenase HmoA